MLNIDAFKIQECGDVTGGRIQIAGDIDIGLPADQAHLAIGQFESLPQQIAAVNHPIGVRVKKLVNGDRLAVGQARDRQRNHPGVLIADRRWRDVKTHGCRQSLAQQQPEWKHEQAQSVFEQ